MLSQIFKPIFKSVFSSPFADEALISFELKDGTLKPRASGSSTPTFTRNTIATGYDQFNRQYPVAANQPRQDGYEVVENLLAASEDMTNGAYDATDAGTTVDSATQVTFDGTDDSDILQAVTITDNGSGAGGRTFVYSVNIALVTGTISGNDAVEIRVVGNATTNVATSIGTAITAASQRFAVTVSTDAAGTLVTPGIRCDDAITLEITKWQLEEVTGKLSHAPGPYVPSGVGTGVELNTEANASSVTNEADATTGWIAAGGTSTVTSVTETEGDSLYSLRLTADANSGRIYEVLAGLGTFVDGKDYVLEMRYKHVSGDNGRIHLAATTNGTDHAVVSSFSNSAFATIIYPFTYDSTHAFLVLKENGSNDNTVADIAYVSIKEADHGANIDSVKYFPNLNGNYVIDGLVYENTGPRISAKTCQHMQFDGIAGTYVSSPDSAAGNITGDLILIEWIAPDDNTPAARMSSTSNWETTGNERGYNSTLETDGTLGIFLSNNGTDAPTAKSSVATGYANGTGYWRRTDVDVSASTATFYTSTQPLGTAQGDLVWTLLGDADRALSLTLTGINPSSAPIEIGSSAGGTANLFTGKIARSLIISGTDPYATPAVDFNANDYTAGVTFESSSTGEVYTLNGNVGVHCPKGKWADVDGSSDGWTSPDSAAASITGDMFLAGCVAPDDYTLGTFQWIAGKHETTGDQKAYGLYIQSAGNLLRFIHSVDGATGISTDTTVAFTATDGVMRWFAAAIDVDNGNSEFTVSFYTSSDSPWTPHNLINWSLLEVVTVAGTTSIADTSALITVGGQEDGCQSNELAGRIMRAYAIPSTDPTVAPAWDFDLRNHVSGTTATMTTGEVWTAVGNGTIEGGLNPIAPFKEYGAMEPIGYLAETASENVRTESNGFTTWTNTDSADTANYAIAPDGQKTAWRLIDNSATGTGSPRLAKALTVTTGSNVYSIYAKADQLEWVTLLTTAFDTGNDSTYFDVKNGVVGTIGANHDDAGIVPLPNGWFRCWASFTTGGADNTGATRVYVAEADLDIVVDLDGTSSILIWGAQVEAGTFPTSYVPTTTTAVTRNKDELTYASAGNASFPMTVVCDVTPGQNTVLGDWVSVESSDDDRIHLYPEPAGTNEAFVRSGGVTTAQVSDTVINTIGVGQHLAAIYATDDVRLFRDGKSVGTPDTSAAMPVSITTINIGQNQSAVYQPNGHINNVRIYPKVLNANEIKSRAQS